MEISDVSAALQERLGAEATAGLLQLFETARQEWTADVTTTFVDRFERRLIEELGGLRVEIVEVRSGLRSEIAALRQEMATAIAAVRQEMTSGFAALRQEGLENRVELLKWCFAFWVGQVFAVGGVVAVLLRLGQR